MFQQLLRIVSRKDIETLLLDGNYARGPVLRLAVEQKLDLLCPLGRPRKTRSGEQKIGKQDFRYDEANDRYVCPGGKHLEQDATQYDKRRDVHSVTYVAAHDDCAACPLRSRCVGGENWRRKRIERYEHDEAKEILREVLKNPRARAALARRKAIVEPVFAELRGVQRLSRFRRFGLKGARVEFALHACAHNIRRLLARSGRAGEDISLPLLLWALLRAAALGRSDRCLIALG